MFDWVIGRRYTVRYQLAATENIADAAHTLTDALGYLRAVTETTVMIETRRHGDVVITRSAIVAAKPVPEPPVRKPR